MEKKSTHEIRIIHNHYKTELPRSTFMIERIIMSDGVEIYKDIQSVDMYTKDQSSIFSQFENWIDDNVSLEECQGGKIRNSFLNQLRILGEGLIFSLTATHDF